MIREILLGCFLVILSVLAVPNLFASNKEELTVFFKKLLLYQGWIGLIVCILGAIGFVQCVLKIAVEGKPILWLTELLCTAALATIGFLLSYNLIYMLFLSKSKKSEENLNRMLSRIMPLQGKIAIFGAIIGIWSVMAVMMF